MDFALYVFYLEITEKLQTLLTYLFWVALTTVVVTPYFNSRTIGKDIKLGLCLIKIAREKLLNFS